MVIAFITLVNVACKKQRTLSVGGTITFSLDTLKFDTVFTAAGSFTNYLEIYNPQDEEVVLSSVRLQEGTNSYFHLNVDGFPGNNIPNLKIAAHDSIYVFATVTIDPNNTLTPFFVTDSLIATLNGKEYFVPFTAYGQNAHYIISDSMKADTTWTNDKPYVVIHTCVVGNLGGPPMTLTIQKNCRIYMHQDARFVVYGTMNVNKGSTSNADSVIFQGDRLDRVNFNYMGYPGEWGGIWIAPGGTGNFSYATLKNCGGNPAYYNYLTQGAAMEVDTFASLTIDHCIIENSYAYGILGFAGKLTATNCLVQTTGAEALAIIEGGTASVTNCTFANYGSTLVAHQDAPTVAILNYFSPDGVTYNYGTLNAVLRNCIIYGSLDSEIICDASSNGPASLLMDHCLVKMGGVRESFVQFNDCIFNQSPLFKDTVNANFHLTSGSPAIDRGDSSVNSMFGNADLDGWPRGITNDIGCYQYH